MPTNCLSEFDHFVGLALKGLKWKFDQKLLTVVKGALNKFDYILKIS